MKRISTILIAITFLAALNLYGQDTLVQWTFPGESAYADGGIIPENLDMIIETAGGTGEIEFKNGATSKAARATGWHEGADEKKWRVDLITTGYHNLRLSSKVSSGGENPGPRDWKVQYRVDGSWTDVPDSEFVTANDWETGVLNNLVLPQECADQGLLKLRWIMTSDTAHDGSIVAETGISKIDDIFVIGDMLDNITEKEKLSVNVFPNPAIDFLEINVSEKMTGNVVNIHGQIIDKLELDGIARMDITGYKPGVYLLITETENRIVSTTKFIVK